MEKINELICKRNLPALAYTDVLGLLSEVDFKSQVNPQRC